MPNDSNPTTTGWQPIETAPKGDPAPREWGPEILGVCVHEGWNAMNFVRWRYHANTNRGNWHGPHGVWEPDFWMPLPEPPKVKKEIKS